MATTIASPAKVPSDVWLEDAWSMMSCADCPSISRPVSEAGKNPEEGNAMLHIPFTEITAGHRLVAPPHVHSTLEASIAQDADTKLKPVPNRLFPGRDNPSRLFQVSVVLLNGTLKS